MDELRTLLIPAVDGLAYGLLLSLLAAGLSLCWATGRVLNLAHGAVYLIGAYTTATLSHGDWPSLIAAIGVGTLASGLAGGGLAAALAPIVGRGPLPQALLTFGLALVGADLLAGVFGAEQRPVRIPATLDGTVALAGQLYPAYRLAVIVATTAVIGVGAVVLHRTRAGLLARAAVDNPPMLSTFGHSPRRIHAVTLVVAGAVAGLAGALGAPVIGPSPTAGNSVLLWCLTVVVLAGLDSRLPALLAAGILVGEVQSVGVIAFPSVAPYLLFGVLAVALVARRTSLSGATS